MALISMPTGLRRRFWISNTNLSAQIPAFVRAAEDGTAVDGVEVDGVEVALVDDVGVVGGDLLEERRFRIGHEQAEAFLEVPGLGVERSARREWCRRRRV